MLTKTINHPPIKQRLQFNFDHAAHPDKVIYFKKVLSKKLLKKFTSFRLRKNDVRQNK